MKIASWVVAIILIGLALLAGLAYLITPLMGGGLAGTSTVAFSMAAFLGALGVGWAWYGYSLQRNQEDLTIGFPPTWAWLLMGGVGLVGGLLTPGGLLGGYLLPVFQLLALFSSAAFLLSLVYKSWGPLKLRALLAQITYGGLGATFFSALLEVVVFLLLAAMIWLLIMVLPGGEIWQAQIAQGMEQFRLDENPAALGDLFGVLPISVGLFLLLAVLVPLIEEGLKTLSVLWLGWREGTRQQMALWGVVAGLGFGLVETLLNLATLGDMLWVGAVGARTLTMLLHGVTGGLMGLGWYYWRREGRFASWLGCFAASFALHALWNGTVVVLMILPTWLG